MIDNVSTIPQWFPIEDEPNVNGNISILHDKALAVRDQLTDIILEGIHKRSDELHTHLSILEDDDIRELLFMNKDFLEKVENLPKACELIHKSSVHIATLTKAIEDCTWKYTHTIIPTFDQLANHVDALNANKTVDIDDFAEKISTSVNVNAIHESQEQFVNCLFDDVLDIKNDLNEVMKEFKEFVSIKIV